MTSQIAASDAPKGSGEPVQMPPIPPTQVLEQEEPKKGQAVLDSPRDFGIFVKGILVRFRKGRTPLTPELAKACEEDSYVKDNGAEVIYRPKATNNRKGELK